VRWHAWPASASLSWVPGAAGDVPAGEEALDAAARALDAGSILAHPTSTVYGLGGRPSPACDARVAALKGRVASPLIVLAAGREAVFAAFPGLIWTETAERLAEAFWPGPLTLVLAERNGSSRAVRVEGHAVARAVLDRAGGVMTSTSLNATGAKPARARGEVLRAIASFAGPLGEFGWLDAGDLPVSATSTLVRPGDGRVEVLREGAITRARLEGVL